jgi:A/G-specific adenine glycosylase
MRPVIEAQNTAAQHTQELAERGAAAEMRAALLAWYEAHRRDLPWRRTRDPYCIWVSEIMLQQTRVAAVLDHYRRFLKAFPTIAALAAAEEPEVLALWSGLGYYRRARMLHRAAVMVVAEHGGVVPQSSDTLLTLPGVGAYTAAAVASIAFGEAVAVVDGNVERVLARVAGWSAAEPGFAAQVRELAGSLVDPERPGDFNQAMMELGATVCLPRGPLCLACPWQRWCRTRGEHPMPARIASKRQNSARVVYVRGTGARRQVRLLQRPATERLMAGMWELPVYVPSEEASGSEGQPEAPAFTVRHAITVTNHVVDIYTPSGRAPRGVEGKWVAVADLERCALTGLTRKVLRRIGCLSRVERAVP